MELQSLNGLGSTLTVPVTLVDAVEPHQRAKAASEKPTRVARASRIEIRCLNGRVLIVETGFDVRWKI